MYISSKPTFWFRQVRKHGRFQDIEVFPFNSPRCSLFFSARYALAAAVRALGLTSDENILMPSYNCWVEIDPILYQGLRIKYYRITKTFSVDLDDLRAAINEKTRAVLITHYLGFPQPLDEIREVCEQYKLILIEDCAHAFLSEYKGRPVGSFGDISIFSFRKTLPIPDGAALVINTDRIIYKDSHKKPNIFSTYYVIAEYLKNQTSMRENLLKQTLLKLLRNSAYWSFFATRLILRILHKIFKDKGLYLVYPSGNLYREEIADWGVSPLSKRIISSSDFEQIKKIRRRNFKFLLNYFGDDTRFCLPIKELPVGVCPLFFPIFSEKRDVLYSLLKRRGIAGHDWWGDFHPDVPWRKFPDARFMKAHVFGFPIHQDLTLLHLQKIIEEFETAYKQHLVP